MDRNEELKTYSLALFEVLDKVGASEYIRNTRRHAASTQEILISIAQNAVHRIACFTHIFGSSVEGTSTPGLHSDIDTVVSADQPIVVEQLSDTKKKECVLMIQDAHTPPGYTKLLYVEDGKIPPDGIVRSDDEALDVYFRPVYKNKSMIDAMTYDERNGPAGTTLYAKHLPTLDYVPALRCKRWPKQAAAWLDRPRPYSFPSKNVTADFKKYGFFVVPVGQPFSPEKPLEWRLSFSIQERKMMFNLNPVQFKCYVTLKMIKNDFIKPYVKGKSLTSYHCKTCLFYIMESTNPEMFIPEKFVACLMKCINLLFRWLKAGFLPNYFVPEENMWKGNRKSRLHVARILQGHLIESPHFLTKIACDHAGTFLQRQLLDIQSNNEHEDTTEFGPSTSDSLNEHRETTETQDGNNDDRSEACEKDAKGSANEEEDDDSIIVDAIVEALTMEGDNSERLNELRQIFPESDEIIKNISKALAAEDDTASLPASGSTADCQDKATLAADPTFISENEIHTVSDSTFKAEAQTASDPTFEAEDKASTDSGLTFKDKVPHVPDLTFEAQDSTHVGSSALASSVQTGPNATFDAILAEQQHRVDVSLYKWHYWTVDYVFGSAKELVETTIHTCDAADHEVDPCDLDQCIDQHRELLNWLGSIDDFDPRMEFSKLDFQIVKAYLLPFIYISLGSQLAVKAITATTDEREGCLQESESLLAMGHTSDALSGIIKHAAVLFMQGNYARAEEMLDDLFENMENYVTSWGRCYLKSDFVHEVLCNRIRDRSMSTQEVVTEGVAACITYLPTEKGLVPKELMYEMYRSVFATTPRHKHDESWFDYAVVDAKVYMYYLLYKIYGGRGDVRGQGSMVLFLIMTLEQELNLGHPETAQNLLGCLFKEQSHLKTDDRYLKAAWDAFVESWILRPDHNAAKWHMCIMIAEAVAKLEAGDRPRERRPEDPGFVEVLYKRTA